LPPALSLWIRRVFFGVVLVISMVMLFSPASDVPKDYPLNDKVVHAILFLVLGVAGLAAQLAWRGITVAALAGYAAVSEILQEALPIGRDGSWGDLAADLVGIILAVVLLRLLASRIAIKRTVV
jgi:VanZ family protein